MTFASDLVSRLEQQRSRIQRMLLPGLKNRSGGFDAPLSAVASDFAGRKFKIAAKQMQVLSSERIKPFYARTLTPLMRALPQKYQKVKDVIHVRPLSGRNASIWSELETVFPGMRNQPEREISSSGGVLRQGSIIQKLKTVPNPEQSLESFRKQIESQPRQSRTPAQRKAKQPGFSPRDRLYSRVQEIKPGEKPEIAETAGGQETVPEISAVQRPTVESVTKNTASQQSIQRQVDAPVSKQDSPTVTKQPDLPVEKNELLSKTKERTQPVEKIVPQTRDTHEIRTEDHVKLTEQKDQTSIVDQPKDKVSDTERPSVTKAIAKPVDKQDVPQASKPDASLLLKALPVREEKPATPALKKALPVKKAKRSDATSLIRAPQQPPVSRQSVRVTTSAVVQRTPAKPESKPVQISSKPQAEKNAPPVEQLEQPEVVESTLPENEEQEFELKKNAQSDDDTQMPLGRMVKANQEKAMSMIHRQETPMTLPKFPKHLLMQAFTKPLPRQRSRSDENMPQYADGLFPSADILPKVSPGGTQKLSLTAQQSAGGPQQFGLSQAVSGEAEMEMPIASQQPVIQALELPGKPLASQNKPSPAQEPHPAVAASPSNVIQRLWEEHTGGQSQGGDSGGSAESSSPGEQIGGLDLEILAEEVYPYVKRIIEIEANRSFKI